MQRRLRTSRRRGPGKRGSLRLRAGNMMTGVHREPNEGVRVFELASWPFIFTVRGPAEWKLGLGTL